VKGKPVVKKSGSTVDFVAGHQRLWVWLREGALLALVALSLSLLLALGTYHVNDPGFSRARGAFQVQNAVGRTGAWLADLLFLLLGYCAWAIPLLLALKAVQIFRNRHQPWRWRPWLWTLRGFALLMLLLSVAALWDIYCHPGANMPGTAGGIFGQSVAGWATDRLNVQGGSLLLVVLSLFGLTLFADFSWLALIDWLGKITADVLTAAVSLCVTGWRVTDTACSRKNRKNRPPPA